MDNNGNRPTTATYCAGCGSTYACRSYRERHPDDVFAQQCVMSPKPLTLRQTQTADRNAALLALTDEECRYVMNYLAAGNEHDTDMALKGLANR